MELNCCDRAPYGANKRNPMSISINQKYKYKHPHSESTEKKEKENCLNFSMVFSLPAAE